MPQLVLRPWFPIMVVSWLILLIVLVPKVEKHKFNNQPMTSTTCKPESAAWIWTWH